MGTYNSAIMTNKGINLTARALNGNGIIQFTSVKTSSNRYPETANFMELLDLQSIKQSTEPFSAQIFGDTVLQVSSRFDNDEITEAYLIETLGIYAKIGEEDEILFAVVTAVTPDQMPVQSAGSPSAFIYNIQFTIQNASRLTVTVNPAGTATVQDILEIRAEIEKVNTKVEKALRDVIVTVPTTWTGETAPYTQIISVPDIKVGDPAELWSAVTADTSAADVKTWTKMAAMINAAEISADGKLTLICRLKKPTAEFKIRLKGVSAT